VETKVKTNPKEWSNRFDFEFRTDNATLRAYSTDASVYQETPLAVSFPRTSSDIQELIKIANSDGLSLIPRTAGTSLAGQVVGSGIVVDVSKFMNQILEINEEEKWVRVQPGVIRDELNMELAKVGLVFGPETSTSNRAMIGGMLGNNSCGSNSIVYGSPRDQTIEVTGLLSDGTSATFGPMSADDFHAKSNQQDSNLETQIYRGIADTFQQPQIQTAIRDGFPLATVSRRNTGYALDALIENSAFCESPEPFNMCKLIAGSEGTLFFATEIKLQCHDLPPEASGVVCAHFESINDSLKATLIAMKHEPFGCELMDHFILEGAARNIGQRKNLDFVEGKPAAVLIIHIRAETKPEVRSRLEKICEQLKSADLGYAYPMLVGRETSKIWSLRKAGLGIVANVPGDSKPTTIIEDTAVALDRQPEYIAELAVLLKEEFDTECVHYGHAGAGELHLRPILNLKTAEGRKKFRRVGEAVAAVVKRYGGSLSGEHGDGRLRGEFIEQMVGSKCYELMRQIKTLFDPNNVFNPGKIIDTPPMDTSLRFRAEDKPAAIETVYDFSESGGMLGAAEMCSGSGDCRKTELTGGTMCPSYMGTRDEIETTRARANVLRQVITESTGTPAQRLNNQELKQVMDLCLSCKGCKSECPSNVDMAKLKGEFLQSYYDANGVPRKAKLVAGFATMANRMRLTPWLYNLAVSNRLTSKLVRKHAGFHKDRSIPKLAKQTLRSWFAKHTPHAYTGNSGKVRLFCDEFTNHMDVDVGIAAVEVLERLGFEVQIPHHEESGRAAISKGLLRDAREIAKRNIALLSDSDLPLVGIEPSALLTLRDEYPDLVRGDEKTQALKLAEKAVLIDEFIDSVAAEGQSMRELFVSDKLKIRLHGHCHQKAIASLAPTVRMLQLPENYRVRLIPSGCCGMAGSFGFEEEHYDLSMKIGELVLFPTVRKEPEENLIAAAGTSCRHQIVDGTGRAALHPIQILRNAMK